MSNDYDNQPLYGKHVSELMRRINALEAGAGNHLVSSGISIHGGEVYVSGSLYGGGAGVTVYSPSGTLKRQFTTPNSGRIDVYNGEIYMCGGSSIRVMDSSGSLVRNIVTSGFNSYDLSITRLPGYSYDIAYVTGASLGGNWFVSRRAAVSGVDLFSAMIPNQPTNISVYNGEVFAAHYITPQTYEVGVFRGILQYQGGLPLQPFLRSFGSPAPGCSGIVACSDGVFVGGNDSGGAFVKVYDLDGSLIRTISVLHPLADIDVSGGELYASTGMYGIYVYGVDGAFLRHFGVKNSGNQSTFWAYKPTVKQSLGVPDAGISIPTNNALCDAFGGVGASLASKHILDMRTAIGNLVTTDQFIRTGTTPYTMGTLYAAAMGDRTKYGATGGARSTWTRGEEQMIGTPLCGIDIGEIYECVRVLESATRA